MNVHSLNFITIRCMDCSVKKLFYEIIAEVFFSFSFPKLFISYTLKITDSIDVKRVILMCWSNIPDIFSLAH